jgi:hypothetical protein
MKKFLYVLLAFIVNCWLSYIVYNVTYSEGVRSGQLIKFSTKGWFLKLGKEKSVKVFLSTNIFFSVLDKDQKVINDLQS